MKTLGELEQLLYIAILLVLGYMLYKVYGCLGGGNCDCSSFAAKLFTANCGQSTQCSGLGCTGRLLSSYAESIREWYNRNFAATDSTNSIGFVAGTGSTQPGQLNQ